MTLWATFTTAGSVSVRRSGAQPADPLLDASAAVLLSGAGAGAGRQFPLSVGLNYFELNSTLDGYYRFTLERLPQDVTAFALLPVAATPDFVPLPLIQLAPLFQADTLHYTLSVPAVAAQLQLLATFPTVGSLQLTQSVDAGTATPVSGTAALALPLAVLPFAPLRSWFVVDSTQDGRYSVDVIRAQFDTQNPLLQSYDQHGVASGPLTLVPPFATGIWLYNATMPYGAVRSAATPPARRATPNISSSRRPISQRPRRSFSRRPTPSDSTTRRTAHSK